MIEPDPSNIAAGLRRKAQENDAAQTIAQQITGAVNAGQGPADLQAPNPTLVPLLRQWSHYAPTMPAGAILSVSQAGIDPNSDLGNYLITNAVPKLLYKPSSAMDPAQQARNLFNDPATLTRLKSMSLADATQEMGTISSTPPTTPSGPDPITGEYTDPSFGGAGVSPETQGISGLDDLGSAIKTGTREAGAVASAGLQTIMGAGAQQTAGLFHSASNLAHGKAPSEGADPYGIPYDPTHYKTPSFTVPGLKDVPGLNQLPGIKESPELNGYQGGGVPITFGSDQQLADIPGQTALGQQILHGKSLGQGYLPGGTATEAAQQAQKDASTFAGHSFTFGRALASFVTTPDSIANRVFSGAIDAQVALHGDPVLLVTGELTDAIKNAQTIAPTTMDAVSAVSDRLIDRLGPQNANALRDWAGFDGTEGTLKDAIVKKITADPASLPDLYKTSDITAREMAHAVTGRKAGLISGLSDAVHPQNFLQWLVDPQADQHFFTPMSRMGFTEIGTKTGWSLDADLHAALAKASTPDEARAALADNLSSIRTLPTIGKWPIHDMRWASNIPTGLADVNDPNSLLTRARQDLQLFKVPVKEWDNFLPQTVDAAGSYDDAFKAFKAIGDRGAINVLEKLPRYQGLVNEETDLKAAVRALGDHVVPTAENQGLVDRLATVQDQLDSHEQLARRLTNYFYERGNQSRLWHNSEIGGAIQIDSGLNPAGGPTLVEGPFWPSELLNRGIPTPGGYGGLDDLRGLQRDVGVGVPNLLQSGASNDNIMREIQRAVGTWSNVFQGHSWSALPRSARALAVDMIADNLTDTMKKFAFAHLGTPIRIVGSQGARYVAAGTGELAGSPLSALALAMDPELANVDLNGEALFSTLGGAQNRLAATVGRATDLRSELAGGNKYVTNRWVALNTNTREGLEAWANRLSHASNDPFASQVAKALVEGEGLDAVKASVRDGALAPVRQQMQDANVTWGRGDYVGYSKDLVNPDQSDAWVEATAKILQTETGNDPELLQHVADGVGNIDNKFLNKLKRVRGEGFAPLSVTGPAQLQIDEGGGVLKKSVNAMLSTMGSQPTRRWLAIPAVKQLYWEDAQRLLPYLSEADAASIRGMASAYGVELPEVAKDATHTITLAQADHIAKAYAIDGYSKIFYTPGARPILVDQLRNIIPFANIVGDTARTWARLVAENPKILRVAQMGLTDANQSGWFSKDQYGKMAFAMIPGEATSSLIGGMNLASGNGTGQDNPPFPISGEASRLNIVTQGWPSVGPVVSLGMPTLLAAFGQHDLTDKILNYTDPYGTKTDTGSVLNSLLPGWVDKLQTSGYFASVPGLGPTEYQQRMLKQTVMAVFRYKMSTGHYSPQQMDQVWKDASHDAQFMYLIQTAAQFISPVAPQVTPMSDPLPGGAAIQTYLITNDYYKMLKANQGDTYKTTTEFVKKYGPDNIFAAQPMTRPTIYGLPTTAEAQVWKGQHSTFATKYDQIYGYFAPQGGAFSYQSFLQQLADKTRVSPTGKEWYSLAEARLGNAVWDQFRRTLPAHLSAADQVKVDQFKQQLTDYYPGFNQDHLKLSADTQPTTINNFKAAIQDPAVKGTPMAKAIGEYLGARDQMLAAQTQMGLSGKSVSTSARAADLRNTLYQYGQQLAAYYPQFANVWQSVFAYEVDNSQTKNAAA